MNKKGFTLIELLIVVAIIGILAAVGATVIPGLLENAKVNTCKQQHNILVNYVAQKFLEVHTGGSSIVTSGGSCFQYFVPPNAMAEYGTTDIATLISQNNAVPTLCNHTPAGDEHYYGHEAWAMGFRNCRGASEVSSFINCGPQSPRPTAKPCPALLTPGAQGSLTLEGSTTFRCGPNAGLSDSNACELITILKPGVEIKDVLIKN
jgi:prepilin-type N-terminal cleavage/methylation domain-containing protein